MFGIVPRGKDSNTLVAFASLHRTTGWRVQGLAGLRGDGILPKPVGSRRTVQTPFLFLGCSSVYDPAHMLLSGGITEFLVWDNRCATGDDWPIRRI